MHNNYYVPTVYFLSFQLLTVVHWVMGDAMRTCLETGSWSGDEPTCSGELQHVRNPLHIYTLACVLVSIAFNKSA